MFKIYRPISALLLVASLGSAWNASNQGKLQVSSQTILDR